MAGFVQVEPGKFWSAAGWLYDNVIESTAQQLATTWPSMSAHLYDSTTERNGGFYSITEFHASEIEAWLSALREVAQATSLRGPASFHMPEFFPGYMERLEELIVLVQQRLDQLQQTSS